LPDINALVYEVPVHVIKRLWETKKSLQHLDILPSSSLDAQYDQIDQDTHIAISDLLRRASFDELKSIRVIPEAPGTASLCSIALRKIHPGALTALEVGSRHWADAKDRDQLVATLFSHVQRVLPGNKRGLDSLTTLVLKDVKMTSSKYTWHAYLNLTKLQRLELHHCEGVDLFLLWLTSGHDKVPALTRAFHASFRSPIPVAT
jgi:hypothetical protein